MSSWPWNIPSTGQSDTIKTESTAGIFGSSTESSFGLLSSKCENAPVATSGLGFGVGFHLPFTSATTTASARGMSLGLPGLVSSCTSTQPSTDTSLFPSSTGIETVAAITTTTGTLGGFGTSSYVAGFGRKAATTTTTGRFGDLKIMSLETGFGTKAPTTTTSDTFGGSGTSFGIGTSVSSAFGSATPVLESSNQQSNFSKPYLGVISTTAIPVFSIGTTSTSNLLGASTWPKMGKGFGSNTTTQTMGTPIKFIPATGTDTEVKIGVIRTIKTQHHCITCMREYEAKSLEELRLEDYMLNHKGPWQTPEQSGLFGTSTPPSLFGSAPGNTAGGGSLLGDKPLFGGGTTMGFRSGTGIFGSNSLSLFYNPACFGAVTTTTGFSFSTTNTSSPFGASTQSKLFGGFKATSSKNVETDPIQQLTDTELSKIWSILECPVCLDVVLPPVFQCETGHHACNSCWENLSSCPLCKSCKSKLSRNFVAEAIVELVKLPCRFRVDGCKDTVLLTKKLEHEKVCPHHKFDCPVSDCKDKQNYQTVSGHLSQEHGLVVTEVTDPQKIWYRFSKTIEINKLSSLIHGFIISDWGFFLLCSKTTESKTLLWMQMLAAPGKSSTFTYKIHVVDHLDRHGVSYSGTVALLDKSVDEIQEDDCLHMIDILLKSLQINCLKITVHINDMKFGLPLD
ncbi:nuclear pore complex protein DDB_G0274915 isoform X8 [Anabrus simplex]|uniref:nuclear pore complex protein DDB_G0274915 isoform X8 n=1 Tax=Anabrus simplex TaxID=316456 RepID=UPI0035A2DE47